MKWNLKIKQHLYEDRSVKDEIMSIKAECWMMVVWKG